MLVDSRNLLDSFPASSRLRFSITYSTITERFSFEKFTFHLISLFLSLIMDSTDLDTMEFYSSVLLPLPPLRYFNVPESDHFVAKVWQNFALLRGMAITVKHTVFAHWLTTWVVYIYCFGLASATTLLRVVIRRRKFYSIFPAVTIMVGICRISWILEGFPNTPS